MNKRFGTIARRLQTRQDGFILLWVLMLVLVISISLAVAAPKLAVEIQRDKELEFYHRGQQYARAIRLYYARMGHFPTDISQLEKTNDIRFLRKRYRDPITGAADWRLIHQGEAKSQLMGLFGQPYAGQIPGSSVPGTPIGQVASSGGGAMNGGVSGTSATGATSYGGGSGLGGNSSFGGGFGSGGFSGNNGFSGGVSTGSGSGFSGFGLSNNAVTNSTSAGNSSSSDTGNVGSTFSSHPGFGDQPVFGAGIVGVGTTSKKESIRVYKKQTHYNQWEFVYNPAEDGIGGGIQPGMNTPGIVASTAAGATGGVNVDPNLSLPPAPGQPPPTPPPAAQE